MRFLAESLRTELAKEHTPSIASAIVYALAAIGGTFFLGNLQGFQPTSDHALWAVPLIALVPSIALFAWAAYADYVNYHRERLAHAPTGLQTLDAMNSLGKR